MVLVTVAAGFVLGARGASHPSTLLLTLLGTGLVAGGRERLEPVPGTAPRPADEADRRPTAAQRPARPGRGRRSSARRSASPGIAILALGVNLIAAAVALMTFVLYVCVYTPLKPVTTLNTAVGAVPGALAAGDRLGRGHRPARHRGRGPCS